MQVVFRYGSTEEAVEISDQHLLAVAQPPRLPAGGDEQTLLAAALADPVGTPRLRDLARGRADAAIIVSDHTRPTPSRRILPVLLEELAAGGLDEKRVSVVVATGLHDPTDRPALGRILGEDLLSRLRVVVHSPDDPSLVEVGTTSNGTPLRVNRTAAEADLLLSVSTVSPHHTFGWSGGAKNIIPGISSRQTVNVNHGRRLTHQGGVDKLEGNIFRDDAEEAARLVGLAFILNVALNERLEIIGAVAGDVVAAHRRLVDTARAQMAAPVPGLADIIVVGVGGPPRDAEFWQAHGKGMLNTRHAVREGGAMILVAGCEKGLGPSLFRRYMGFTGEELYRWNREQGYSVPLYKAFDIFNFTERRTLYLVTPGLSREDLPHLPARQFASVTAALEAARADLGADAKVLAVPDGSRVVITLPR
ncbi:MAG: nickel-dependent lactate racemase family protein [Chloroflexota bacterium]